MADFNNLKNGVMTAPPHFYPAISVAIPMYNVEKYIGALLESLLNQTFQDFEVIVVNNGSTDNSPAILESYMPKFDGRLKISHIKVNSGSPSPAYNRSVALARGKYVYVMDSDDLLVPDALETFYNYAEEYNADVVYTDKGFKFFRDSDKPFPTPENLQISGWQGQGPFVDKPTLDPEDIGKRVKTFCRGQLGWPAWEKLVRRDLILEHDIKFPLIKSSADIIYTIEIMLHAKNFLRIPQPLYIYRSNPVSITRKKRTLQEDIDFWMEISINGMKYLDDWLGKQEFFQNNPQYKWDLLEMFERIHFNNIINALQNIPPHETYNILQSKFSATFGEYSSLIAYLCNSSNLSRLRGLISNQRALALENHLKQIQGG